MSLLVVGCDQQVTDIGLSEPDCDPLMNALCALPWPSNLYLTPDASRKTGYTLAFGPSTLPRNGSGKAVAPDAYRRLDGYSVGTPLIVQFPDLDVSGLATEDHVERSLAADAPILWFAAPANGPPQRVPYFVELDQNQSDPAARVLLVRPAVILEEATRYVVAFRSSLRSTAGGGYAPAPSFRALRDGLTADVAALRGRQAQFDQVFTLLEGQGVARGDLTLAWDFVTASDEALHGDLLTMRDIALKAIVATPVPLSITTVKEVAEKGRWEITGEAEVPSFLAPITIGSFSGSQLARGADGKVAQNGTRKIPFYALLPQTVGAGDPHGLVFYGHGLFGRGIQVFGDFNGKIANDHKLVFVAADLTGMMDADGIAAGRILGELSAFSSLTDRLHQGLVEWIVLTRVLRDNLPELVAKESRLTKLGKLQLDRGQVYYSGISQGGIFGASFMALSPDVKRGHLGVPGNNYSTLLPRSVDFNFYKSLMDGSYPDPSDQAVLLSAMQLLWDATDPVTHLRHIVQRPYPGSNGPHQVLLAAAKGDHEVAVLTDEIVARTAELQIPILGPYDRERQPALVKQETYPRTGSGIVLYDFGNPWPWLGNRPPEVVISPRTACRSNDECGGGARVCEEIDTQTMIGHCEWRNPHGSPRKNDEHNRQMVNFFRTGEIIDVCGGDGCTPN